MRVLHTSDWHIGRTLYGKKRYEEFESFLSWLAQTIQRNQIDVLLVAGDIFDTSTPSNRSQQLYYEFLCRVAASACRHVVIVAGNHDSPTFLDAPKELLKALDVHVVGGITESLQDEVLALRDEHGAAELIVCAVPYLRDREIRVAQAGESVEDKGRKLIDGIRDHYADVAKLAEQKREELGVEIPIVAMGHLFTSGGETVDGDGVRELYVGSLAHVSSGIFPACFDYVALGHLHVPQKVNNSETIRYSGSPLPMGFGEEKQKSVCQVEFHGKSVSVQQLNVPLFRKLERIEGNLDCILSRILELSAMDFRGWLEIIYQGGEVIGNLQERLQDAISGTQMEVLRIKNNRIIDNVLKPNEGPKMLDDLSVNDVFKRCLSAHNVPKNQRPELCGAYRETILSLQEDDLMAE